MTVVLRGRDDLTLAALSRVAFGGEPAGWVDQPPMIEPVADDGANERGGSVRGRPLPPVVARAVAFAVLSRRSRVAPVPTVARLTERGLAAAAANDGLAVSSALGCVVAILDRRRLELTERILALSIEAYRAPLDAYHPTLAELWGDPYQRGALEQLDRLLAGGEPARQRHQGPVSYRIVPRLTGQARRALAQLEEISAIALRGPVTGSNGSDSPPDMLHDAPVAAAIDAMSATWAEIAALAHRHVVRLARAGGARLVEPVLAPTEAADEARRLAQPAVLGALELSADPFEDIRSLSPAAYLSHRRVTACLDEVLAALSAACVQAPALHGGTVSSSLAALVAEVRRHAAADSDAWSADRLASLADAITDSIDGGRSLGT